MVFSRGSSGFIVPGSSWAPRAPLTLQSNRSGLYQYDPRYDDALFPKKKAYSFWGASKWIFVLSLMLWWIPTFGQMIAGYVGGRKAGNHWVAALAAFFPVLVIWIFSLIAQASGTYPELTNLVSLPAAAAFAIGDAIPLFQPSIQFLVAYVTSFAIALRETVSMGMNGYLVTIIFAYIGGLIAAQTLRERQVEAEATESPLALPAANPIQAVPILPVQAPRVPVLSSPAGWYRAHPEEYDTLRRIPVGYGYDEEPLEDFDVGPPAQRRLDEGYPSGEAYPRRYREPRRGPAPRRAPRLDRDELIRRLVERALRDYDRSVR